MAAAFLLAWRLHRAELAAVAVAALGLSAWDLSVVPELDRLVAMCRAATELVAPCGGLRDMGTIYNLDVPGTALVAVLPFAAGVILGAPLVSGELEHATARLTWAMSRGRARWLLVRFAPVVLIGLAVLIVPAMAGEIVQRALWPAFPPDANFEGYNARGPLLALRFVPAVTLAALVGAVIGRQLPAILVTGVILGAGAIGLMQTQKLWLEPVEQPEAFLPIEHAGNLYVTMLYRYPDGTLISEEEAFARHTFAGETPDPNEPVGVMFVIPRERYPEVVLREGIALLGASAALGGLLLVAVQRRHPD